MKFILLCISIFLICSCKNSSKTAKVSSVATDNGTVIPKDFTEFKVLDSKYINNTNLWEAFEDDLKELTTEKYTALKLLILEQDIPTLQAAVSDGLLSYETLVKFYLYRIRQFDRDNPYSLNSVISINPNIIAEARQRDRDLKTLDGHPIYGMPILLKDNINATGMPTTAGAVAFQNNRADDAFIVQRLKENGALILGKANLSEWAYFFCGDCPSGYSAIGGQTLNPYGRRTLDTGGSSSGSGVAVAANFCVAAVGTETSGSILSPASNNSGVGLKPTVGLVSRSGIIPISSALDTPGPMAKNVTDTAILLDAMLGYDAQDFKSRKGDSASTIHFIEFLKKNALRGKRFGVLKSLLEDSLYVRAVSDLKSQGAICIEIDEDDVKLPEFTRLLNLDMKKDFPKYVKTFGDPNLTITSVEEVVAYNKKDSLKKMPYGQRLFLGIVADAATDEEFSRIKNTLKMNGRQFFDFPFQKEQLDAILSINNYHASYAAVAEYPAITVPMGFAETGAPEGLTFIGLPWSEAALLSYAYNYEQATKRRVAPVDYR